MAVNPSIQLGTDGNWAIKEDNLLAYKKLGSRFFNREFDFSRGTTATFVGEDGLIQESAIDVPRIDFADDTTGHLLLEPQSTNLVTYSEDFSNGSWTKQNNATVTSNSTTSPNGEIDADLLNCPTTSRLLSSISVTSGVKYTFSIFIKKGTSSLFSIDLYDGGSNSLIYNFDTNVVSGGVTDNSIEDYGNGWHKLSGTITTASTTLFCFIYGNGGYSENEANTYIWGAQLEQQSYPTSYIPTSGSTVTRNQEICNNSGTVNDFNSEEGVLYAEMSSFFDVRGYVSISDGNYGNSIRIGFRDNDIRVWVYVANTQTISQLFEYNIFNMNKIAVKYSSTDFKIYINGSNVFSTTSLNYPIETLNKLAFRRGDQYSPFYGKTKNIQVFKRALTDAELYLLTVTQYESYQEMATALNYTL